MLHYQENLFFGRKNDGSVRVLEFKHTPEEFPSPEKLYPADELWFDCTIPPMVWASIVASVAKGGETTASFNFALSLHQGEV